MTSPAANARFEFLVELYLNGAWRDITADVQGPVTITRGRTSEGNRTDPGTCSMRLDNRSGDYSPRNPSGQWYGHLGRNTPLRVSAGPAGAVPSGRFYGEVSSWPPGWNLNGAVRWVDIEASGILRRLGQGTKPALSALYRAHVTESTVVGYWPLEDVGNGDVLSSPIPGVAAGTFRATGTSLIRPLEWDESTLIGSGTLPSLAQERGLAGVEADLPTSGAPALAASFWTRTDATKKNGSNGIFTQATFTLFLDSGNRLTATLLQWPEGSTGAGGTANTVSVRASSTNSGGTILNTVQYDAAFVDDWRYVVAVFAQSGGNVAVTLYLDGAQVATGSLPTFTLANVTDIRMGAFTQNLANDEIGRVSIGHPAVLAGSTTDLATAVGVLHPAGLGNTGESAAFRIERLCLEEGVPLSITPGPVGSGQMGPQRPGQFLDLLQECVDVDLGVLGEARDDLALTYRFGSTLYNQTPAAIAYTGQLAPPFAPVDDADRARNDVTVSRPDGGTARAQLTSGPLSVQSPPDGIGRYDTSVTVNAADDDQLDDIAGWLLHLGTVDQERYPALSVQLAAPEWQSDPTGMADLLAVDSGDVLEVTGAPSWAAGDVRTLVTGYTETLDEWLWAVTFAGEPAQPWDVAEVDGEARITAGSSATQAALASAGTSLLLGSSIDEGPWTEDAADFPMSVRVGVEQVTASAIDPAVSDTFDRSVTGGWGTADTGQSWSTTGAATTQFEVTGSSGRHIHPAANTLMRSLIEVGSSNMTIAGDFVHTAQPSGAPVTSWVVCRATDVNNYYAAQVSISTANAVTLALFKRVSGTLSALSGLTAAIGSTSSGQTWRIVFAVSGPGVRAKTWRPGVDTEPDWQVAGTDSSLTSGTQGGVLTRLESGNTNTVPRTVFVPEFTVLNPQRVTLSARSVNGVTNSSWPAGTSVAPWVPAVAAL